MRVIISILFIFLLGSFNPQKINDSVEIYLPSGIALKTTNGIPGEYEIRSSDLPVMPFINDDEILSFDTFTNQISFEKEAAKRIGNLRPDLTSGIPFVLTLDRQPILTGYIWNLLSSSECKAYVLYNQSSPTQTLRKGLPDYKYKNEITEKRNNSLFIQALERTGRLK